MAPIDARSEEARLAALRMLELTDTPPEAEYDAIVVGAQHLFGCTMGFFSLIEADRQVFKAKRGLTATQTPREISFCQHTVALDEMMVIRDASKDPRFATNPLVTGPPHIRFYAGMPVRALGPDGVTRLPVGALCVADTRPHDPSPDKLDMLRGMAQVVDALLEARRVSKERLRLALERQEALIAIRTTQRLLQHAERMARIGSWRFDIATKQVHWSKQTYAIHGLDPAQEPDLAKALNFYPAPDRARLEAAIALCSAEGQPWDLELDIIDARGLSRRIRTLGEPERRGNHVLAIIGVVQDVTERYRLERRLREDARTDELTGIATRRAFNERLDEELGAFSEGAGPVTVALLDLDRFKEVNDRLGHAAGDDILREVADRLRRFERFDHYFCARLGGDEFVLLLRGATGTELEAGLAQLLAELRLPVPVSDDIIPVSATIGACVQDGGHDGRFAMLRAADEALYRAKRVQRGTAAIAGNENIIRASDHAEQASHG